MHWLCPIFRQPNCQTPKSGSTLQSPIHVPSDDKSAILPSTTAPSAPMLNARPTMSSDARPTWFGSSRLREDFRLPLHPVYVPVTLIRDGQLLADELAELGKTEQWLAAKLQKQGIASPKDVLIAEWLEGDGLFVQTYQPAERQRSTRRQTAPE